MTREEIEQAAETLEAFQKWRTGEDDRTMSDAGIVAGEVTKAIDLLLTAVKTPPTDHKPCANFCEHIALKHEIKRLKKECEKLKKHIQEAKADAFYEVESLLRYEYEGAYNSSDIGDFFNDLALSLTK